MLVLSQLLIIFVGHQRSQHPEVSICSPIFLASAAIKDKTPELFDEAVPAQDVKLLQRKLGIHFILDILRLVIWCEG